MLLSNVPYSQDSKMVKKDLQKSSDWGGKIIHGRYGKKQFHNVAWLRQLVKHIYLAHTNLFMLCKEKQVESWSVLTHLHCTISIKYTAFSNMPNMKITHYTWLLNEWFEKQNSHQNQRWLLAPHQYFQKYMYTRMNETQRMHWNPLHLELAFRFRLLLHCLLVLVQIQSFNQTTV